jgi:hypothetical protein
MNREESLCKIYKISRAILAHRVTIFLERKSGKTGWNGGAHIHVETDEVSSLKFRTRELTGWCILEVFGSNLGRDTCYHEWFFVAFLSLSRQISN